MQTRDCYAVFEATDDIPEFGVRRGDLLVQDPSDPDMPLAIVKGVPVHAVPRLWDYLDRLRLIHQNPPVSALNPREMLMRVASLEVQPSPSPAPVRWEAPPEE